VDLVGEVLVLVGALLALVAAVGVLRFGDLYSRMHAVAKVPTLALALVALGGTLLVDDAAVRVTLALAVVLQIMTAPVGAHLVGRSAHRRRGVDMRIDAVDELERDERAGEDQEAR